jgi:hypothetical protein
MAIYKIRKTDRVEYIPRRLMKRRRGMRCYPAGVNGLALLSKRMTGFEKVDD